MNLICRLNPVLVDSVHLRFAEITDTSSYLDTWPQHQRKYLVLLRGCTNAKLPNRCIPSISNADLKKNMNYMWILRSLRENKIPSVPSHIQTGQTHTRIDCTNWMVALMLGQLNGKPIKIIQYPTTRISIAVDTKRFIHRRVVCINKGISVGFCLRQLLLALFQRRCGLVTICRNIRANSLLQFSVTRIVLPTRSRAASKCCTNTEIMK